MPKIELIDITKQWGKFIAVDHLNMTIRDRAFVTLLGPSGCGKTTTLRMIAGLETPTSGKIIIDDVVVFDSEKGINISPAKRNVGFLFQNYALWPHMTVKQNIAFGLENLKWKKEDIFARVQELLHLMKIEVLGDRYPSELSGGQQQRVAIARTLAPKPKVLFMDEPLSNLDAKLRLEMRTELKRLHTDTNSTFVYVTHDQLEAMTLATEVCLMKEGIVQQYEPPLTVYSQPNNIFVADFVGNPTMNFIECTAKKTKNNVLQLFFDDLCLHFISENPLPENIDEVVLGIRPEAIHFIDKGLPGTIYSSLPAGMETTVKFTFGSKMITCVVFGIVDYPIDTKVNFEIIGNQVVVFNKLTTERIAIGTIRNEKIKTV